MIAVGVIDVGSPASGKLGWAIHRSDLAATSGTDLDAFVEAIAEVAGQQPVAVGFEAPLFIPLRRTALATLTARKGEGSRSWSAGAGATVTTAALGIMAYTLRQLRDLLPVATASVDWRTLPVQPGELLFFEAFVSQTSKGLDHTHDASIAAEAARQLFEMTTPCASAIAEEDVFSTLGAALLRTGWSTDLALLATPCLVVRPGFEQALLRPASGASDMIERARAALLDYLPKDAIIEAYLAAGGDEIVSGKFASPQSSAALAANAFGLFMGPLERAQRLVWPTRLAHLGQASRVQPEAEMAFPWRGGKRPWLDVRVDAGDRLIGIESKRFEPFRDTKKVAFSPIYFDTDWGPAMAPFTALRGRLSSGSETFVHLDAAQLVKHAFGLRTQGGRDGRKPVLVYLYAEPRLMWNGAPLAPAARDLHREEVDRFAAAVAGGEVSFEALSYDELLGAWRCGADAELAEHAQRVAVRFGL